MPTTETAISTLNIHRLRSLYLLPFDHPAPDAIRNQLDHVAERKFRNAIASAFSQALPGCAEGVWLIRSLSFDVDLNLDAGDDRVAEIWARQAAISVAKVLRESGEADQILHFSSAAAHLAHFLRDLVNGSAWEKWYYRKFEGLRPLPLSAALRTAICREPLAGLEALQQMNASTLRRVLTALTESDAAQTLDGITREGSPQRQLDLPQVNPEFLFYPALDGEHRAALHLYLLLSKQLAETAGFHLKSAAVSLACFVRCLRDASQNGALLDALAHGSASALFQLLAPIDAERLLPLLGVPREWLQSVAQTQLPTGASVPSGETRHTAAGGAFLLLPLLDAMPIAAATEHWPALNKCAPAAIARWIILMKCFGAAGASLIFHDPLVRDLLGIVPQIDAHSLKMWQRTLRRQQLFELQNKIALWQISDALAAESISAFPIGSKPKLALCCGRDNNSLLFALPDSPSSRRLMANSISALPSLVPSTTKPAGGEGQLADPPLAETDLQALLRDLDFLRLPPALCASQRAELTFSVAARALLRNFSGRLMGFSQSGLEYLFSNFLDIPARVQSTAGQSVVRLGQPPLQVILNLAGLNRQSYSLSWISEIFALFPD